MPTTKARFARSLKAHIAGKGWTLSEFGKRAKMQRQWVYALVDPENQQGTTFKTIDVICQTLEIDPSALFVPTTVSSVVVSHPVTGGAHHPVNPRGESPHAPPDARVAQLETTISAMQHTMERLQRAVLAASLTGTRRQNRTTKSPQSKRR